MSLKKTFAIAGAVLVVAAAGGVGVAAAVNGVDDQTVTSQVEGKTVSLHTVNLKPLFEKQVYNAPSGSTYYCWAAASIECPIPVRNADKPAYDALKLQLKK